jgi:RNA polymerase sigma-70 factor (ECF subfamily)
MPPTENLGQSSSLLLPRIAKGDEEAMRKCIDAYGPLVWSIVCRRIDQRTEAEETCQDIFTEIWKFADRFDSKVSKESTFIGMIARRRSIDWQRKQSRLTYPVHFGWFARKSNQLFLFHGINRPD